MQLNRSMNVALDQQVVLAHAERHNAPISAIETILSGGTRVVFMNMADADRMREVFATSLINGNVVRSRWARNG
jgi:hypothetical protein